MIIYDRIKQDHDALRGMMEGIEGAAPDDRRALFDRFKTELWAHTRVEEVAFYAPLRCAEETRRKILEGLNEHHLSDALLDELDAMTASAETWAAKFQVLREILEHHLEEEEEEMFEKAREVLAEAQAETLGREFDRRRRTVADALSPVGIAAE